MKFDIVRAWKDESYRESLSEEERALLPENPAGVELSESSLETVYGAHGGSNAGGQQTYNLLLACNSVAILAGAQCNNGSND
ncbi:mersacidin/lichenicidin family type 2 lantibiotic [Ktedonosporobacter rubrisoli]|uniref:Mersacidin/lichenicidin family type 2 lantibiotic n=1 Tax=Ktedonosporobacter rubrisoli TaxID=2509675 RepID=A0A4P6JYX8_KTERU|nr:mersacidin/lichenicidin family type 2 lantibiotic [Ktedonosporobacter rubrisoli]QBD80924.1 mersacidin/lichenicidin family type 2 lantibiotic [Ktedonosporobacter rubrisoli]